MMGLQVEVGEMNQVFNVMDQLAGDTEPSVRAELMEQVGKYGQTVANHVG